MSDQSQIPFKSLVADPTLADVLNLWKKDVMLNLNCHAIGTVQSFSVVNNRPVVSATISYQKTFFEKDQTSGQFVPKLVDYPILVDCPVVMFCGGGANLTMPIAVGDQCLILFNDRDINNWFAGATTGPVATARFHSISDGLALVGLNTVSDYDTERAVLKNGEAYVAVGTELIDIANEVTSLKEVINGLIDTLNTVLQTGANGAGPVVFSGLSSLPAYKSNVEDLLE